MAFNYEKNTWGDGTATLDPRDPTSFRLAQSLKVVDRLPNGAKVIEVGCGVGRFIRAIKRLRSGLDCFGVDISQNAIDKARKMNDGVSYLFSENGGLDFKGGEFDAVLVYDVLEHAENLNILLSEINRILKPGGFLYAYIPCEGDKLSIWRYLRNFAAFKDLTLRHAGHINRHSRQYWRGLMENHNFKLRKSRYSEHILGQIFSVGTFYLMDKKAKKDNIEINNETFFSSLEFYNNPVFKSFRKTLNFLVYVESYLLKLVPSPNWHSIWQKKN